MSERNREISKNAEIWQQFLGGSQEDVPQTYQLASPRIHLDANDPPTCFISGEFDDASTHADEMRRDCMALGIPTGLLVIPGAPHPFLTKQKFFDIAIDQIDSFFTLHLKQKGVPKFTASGHPPAIAGDWKQHGGGFAGCEGPEWITVAGEPTLIYAAHHDHFAFRWSSAKGLSVWRSDSPEATAFRPDGSGGFYVVEQGTRRVTRWNERAEEVEVLADRFEGKLLNRPNDLRIRHLDGSTTPLWTSGKDTKAGKFTANEFFKDLKIRTVNVSEVGEN